MAVASRCDELTTLELFRILKQRLNGASSNCTSNSPGVDLEEAISIEEEASEVFTLAKGLKNCCSPVGRLPRDVLQHIIGMRALERDLLAASRVCRRWRDIFTTSPHLWTKFKCTGVGRTLQYITRSEPCPINVVADFDSDIRALVTLKSVTYRLGSLTLRLQPSDLAQAFRQLAAPAPLLERLEVHLTHPGSGLASRPSIPATFLGGFTPALKSFHLNGINAKLDFSKFPSLTRLTLITNTQIFDMSELFQVFTSSRLLEEVSVQFSGHITPIPENQHVLQLPRMRKLGFSNQVGEFPGSLLSLLSMPSVEEIKLDIALVGDDVRTIQDFLPPRLRNFPHLLKVVSLKLDVPYAHCNVQFSGPGGTVSIQALRDGNREQNDNFQSHWLGSLEPMSIADVKDLTLRGYHPEKPLGRCPVLKLLRAMDGLQSLVVERCNGVILAEVLSPAEGESILFPHLGSLKFQLLAERTKIFPDLTYMAQARKQAGFPLKNVSSDQYTVFRFSDVETLRPYIDCVRLNTEAEGHPSNKENVTRSASPPTTPHSHILVPTVTSESSCAIKGKNPLADLAAKYSRG